MKNLILSFVLILFSIFIVSGCNDVNTIGNAANAVNTSNNTETESIQEQKASASTVDNPQNFH